MPNAKIYLDSSHWADASDKLREALPDLCLLLCDTLGVERSACHMTLIGVEAPDGQPPINFEVSLLPRADRSKESLKAVASRLQNRIADVSGLSAAIRITTLDPQTYVALK